MRLLFLPHLCVYPSLVLPDPDLFRTQMIPIKYPFYLPLHVFFRIQLPREEKIIQTRILDRLNCT